MVLEKNHCSYKEKEKDYLSLWSRSQTLRNLLSCSNLFNAFRLRSLCRSFDQLISDQFFLWSPYCNRYGCYDKPFSTSLVGARTKEMIHISFRLAVTHCGSLSINFPLLPFCLLSLVVAPLYLAQINRCRYHVKPSLTSLWLNRFARWFTFPFDEA